MKTTRYGRELRAVYGPSPALTPLGNMVTNVQDAFTVLAPLPESAAACPCTLCASGRYVATNEASYDDPAQARHFYWGNLERARSHKG